MHGIRVMPEFDMPGHVTSWLVGTSRAWKRAGTINKIERKAGIMLPAFDPTREETYKFLEGLLRGNELRCFPTLMFISAEMKTKVISGQRIHRFKAS